MFLDKKILKKTKMKRKLLIIIVLIFSCTISAQISLVEDILPGAEQSNPREFIEHDGLLFFIGSTTNVNTIYSMDSSENISIAFQDSGSNPGYLIVFNGALYFSASNQLHRLNVPYGTGSTIVDPTISIWGPGYVFNGELYFGGEQNQLDPLNPNYELMAYNGTSVRLVEEESSISFYPREFVVHKGELHFIGDEIATVNGQPETTTSIYKTDGSSVDLVSFLPTLDIAYLTSLNNELYFLGRQGDFTQPYNLWYSNDTATAGFGDELNYAFGLTIFDNKLHFFDQVNKILYETSQLGNFVPVPIETGTEYPLGGFPITSTDFMSFEGTTNSFGSELYIYESGTEIKFTEDYNSGAASFTPVYGAFFNNKLYVSGDDGSGIGRELHVYNPSVCINTIDIEDSNFETYLENVLGVGDGILGNKKVCQEKIEVLTTLNISGLGISDLTGLEFFSALEILNVSDNDLNSLELQNLSLREIYATNCNLAGKTIRFQNNPPNGSFLTNVTTLELQYNNLGNSGSSIGFGGLPNLIYLDVQNNSFGTIRMGETLLLETVIANNCPNLSTLENLNTLQNLASLGASGSNFTSIDLSQNDALSFINLSSNNLTSIVFPTNSTISDLYLDDNLFSTLDISSIDQNLGYFSVTNNSSLNCIQVSDVTSAEQSGWDKDPGTSYSLDCSTTPFNVTTTLLNAGTAPDYEITEGNSFTINFDADNTATNGEQYTPIVAFSINGTPATDDFLFNGSDVIPNAPFTVSANNPDGSIAVEAKDDGAVEGDEVYTITITSSDTSMYTMAAPVTFTVTVKDKVVTTPFTVSTNLVGAGTGPNYEITEGNSFTINFDADNTALDGDQYTPIIAFSINGNPGTDDFLFNGADTIPNAPFIVSTNNPDGSITVAAKDDGAFEGNEVYTITVTSSDPSKYTLAAPATFTVTVKDQAVGGATIIAVIDNTGGTEGETDTFTLSLKNIDGSHYIADQELVFPISFSPDNNLDPSQRAEDTDFEMPSPSQIVIPAGASSGSITIELPQETSVDDQHEFYLATVMQPSPSINVTLPPPFQAKIIDDEGRFDVFYTINNEILIEADDTGNGCCPYYIVEEGSTISFSFNAEKGALEDNPYEIEIGYSPGASNPGTNPNAIETDDYYTAVGPNDRLKRIFEFDVDDDFENPSGNPDNRLSVKIRDDDGEDDSESFTISISKANALDQFNLIPSSSIYSMEFTIIETIQASIIASDDIADEEDYQNDKGLFTIRLDEEAKTEMEVTYIIEKSEESATNGQDYLLIDGSVLFMQGETEKTIEIEATPDDIPEEEERITIELIDGPGYSINISSDRATVTIPKNDQDKVQFEVTLTTIDAQIYEDSTQQNRGVFEFTIEPPNTSGIDLVVNYAFIENGQSNPATEGAGNDFTQNGTGSLIFESGGSNTQTIEVTALEDPGVGTENTEVITLSLTEGNRYSASNTQNATMEIISTEFDSSSLSSEALQVTVATNTCANTNEGDIVIKNSSQFTFVATVSFENKSVIISGNSEETIKDLPAGRHTVTFVFEDESIELIPPEFEVLIAALEGTNLTGKQVNLTSKTASLQVSGSRIYNVLNGDEEHFFEFNDFKEKRISIPLKDGENIIKIRGEAACQGVIETNLYLNEFVVFPNPTSHSVTLSGFLFEEEAQLTIYDLSGKVFLAKELIISNGSIKVDLSEYPSGLYYGNIVSDSNQDFSFKILKK